MYTLVGILYLGIPILGVVQSGMPLSSPCVFFSSLAWLIPFDIIFFFTGAVFCILMFFLCPPALLIVGSISVVLIVLTMLLQEAVLVLSRISMDLIRWIRRLNLPLWASGAFVGFAFFILGLAWFGPCVALEQCSSGCWR